MIKARYIWKPCNSWRTHTAYSFSTMILVLSLGYFCIAPRSCWKQEAPMCQVFSIVNLFSSVSGIWKLFPNPCTCLAKHSKTQGNSLSIGDFWPLGDVGSFRVNLHKEYGRKKALFLKEDRLIAKLQRSKCSVKMKAPQNIWLKEITSFIQANVYPRQLDQVL